MFSCCLDPYLLLHLYFIWLLYLDWSKNQSNNIMSNKLYGSSIVSVYVTYNMRMTGLFLSHSFMVFSQTPTEAFSWLLGPGLDLDKKIGPGIYCSRRPTTTHTSYIYIYIHTHITSQRFLNSKIFYIFFFNNSLLLTKPAFIWSKIQQKQ